MLLFVLLVIGCVKGSVINFYRYEVGTIVSSTAVTSDLGCNTTQELCITVDAYLYGNATVDHPTWVPDFAYQYEGDSQYWVPENLTISVLGDAFCANVTRNETFHAIMREPDWESYIATAIPVSKATPSNPTTLGGGTIALIIFGVAVTLVFVVFVITFSCVQRNDPIARMVEQRRTRRARQKIAI